MSYITIRHLEPLIVPSLKKVVQVFQIDRTSAYIILVISVLYGNIVFDVSSGRQVQTYVSREALRRQYADKLPSEPRLSSFKRASIQNSVPDPDVAQSYHLDAPEYVSYILFFGVELNRILSNSSILTMSWKMFNFLTHTSFCWPLLIYVYWPSSEHVCLEMTLQLRGTLPTTSCDISLRCDR